VRGKVERVAVSRMGGGGGVVGEEIADYSRVSSLQMWWRRVGPRGLLVFSFSFSSSLLFGGKGSWAFML